MKPAKPPKTKPTVQSTTKEPSAPTDLLRTLAADPKAMAIWKDITPLARRDWISWVDSAKQPETRQRRIDTIGSRMASGKRRPCCFAVVPMNLYKALGASPKAKAQWSTLTPDERRDFASWVESGTDADARKERAEKACTLLAEGKRHS